MNLNGWTIKDNGTDSHVISSDVIIQPGQFAVLGNNSSASSNGNVTLSYQYSGIDLGNGDDEIIYGDDEAEVDAVVDDVEVVDDERLRDVC